MERDRLVIVYNADGGLLGELTYVARKVVGAGSCSLCDITHSMTGQRRGAWKRACARLPVPVDALHRNELDAEARRAADGRYPCVLRVVDGTATRIIEPAELDELGGDVAAFEQLLRTRLG